MLVNFSEVHELLDNPDSLTKDQLIAIRGIFTVASISTNCDFLKAAIETGKLNKDEIFHLMAIDDLIKELLTKVYPNRKW